MAQMIPGAVFTRSFSHAELSPHQGVGFRVLQCQRHCCLPGYSDVSRNSLPVVLLCQADEGLPAEYRDMLHTPPCNNKPGASPF